MATDATGTPTSLGIPKYNTSVDAPSGLGFNAAMDSIDALIAARVLKPAGIVSGEAAVWNGSSWDRSSVTRIGVGSLGSGSPSSANFLRGDGTWAAPGAAITSYATTLPGSPADGDLAVLVDSTTNPNYSWLFRWHSGSSNTDKWEFVGGPPFLAEVTTAETTSSTTYAALTTAGPSVALPRAGVYEITHGFRANTAAGGVLFMSYDIGATGAVDADSVQTNDGGTAGGPSIARSRVKTGLTAVTLTAKYRVSLNTHGFADRWIKVVPVRVS